MEDCLERRITNNIGEGKENPSLASLSVIGWTIEIGKEY